MENGFKRIPEMVNVDDDWYRDEIAMNQILERVKSVDDKESLIANLFARLPVGEASKLWSEVYHDYGDDYDDDELN
jgi:hypothetical protein